MTYLTHFHTSQLLSNRSRHRDTGMKNIIADVPLKTLCLKLTKKAFRIKIHETISFRGRQKHIFTKGVFNFLNKKTRQIKLTVTANLFPKFI